MPSLCAARVQPIPRREHLGEDGTTPRSSIHSWEHDIRLLVHGDDFIPVSDVEGLGHVDKLLNGKYTVKNLGTLGFEDGDSQELCILNRTLRVGRDDEGEYIDWIPDNRRLP